MAVLNEIEQGVITDILVVGKFLHDKITIIFDANVLYDSESGLKARLAKLPNGGQDALDELGALHGMTVQQLNDVAYVVTSLIKPILEQARLQLASTRNFT